MQQIQTPSGTAEIVNLSDFDTMLVVECKSIDDYLSRYGDIIEEQGPIRQANKDYLGLPRFWKHWFKKPEDKFVIKALVFYSFMIDNLEIVSIDEGIEHDYDETLLVARGILLGSFFCYDLPHLRKQEARKRSFTLTDGNDRLTAYVIDTARTKPSGKAVNICNVGDLVRVGISKPEERYYTRHPTCKLYSIEEASRGSN